MKRFHKFWWVDFGSVAVAAAVLSNINAPWWAYVAMLGYGMAQKWDGRQQVKQELAK